MLLGINLQTGIVFPNVRHRWPAKPRAAEDGGFGMSGEGEAACIVRLGGVDEDGCRRAWVNPGPGNGGRDACRVARRPGSGITSWSPPTTRNAANVSLRARGTLAEISGGKVVGSMGKNALSVRRGRCARSASCKNGRVLPHGHRRGDAFDRPRVLRQHPHNPSVCFHGAAGRGGASV